MRVNRLALALSLAIACAGCGPQKELDPAASPKTSGDKTLTIAVIPKGTTHEFWKAIHAGASRAAEELKVDVQWKGPLKEDDREEQIKVVEDFITKKVDGIVLAPLDDSALRVPVTNAQDQKIPVLIIDSALKDVKTVSFVATDNFKAGNMGGSRLSELIPQGGRVIVLRYVEGSASTREREEGALKALKDAGNVIVSDNQYAGATVETAQKASENLIQRYATGGKPQFDGVFCPNESSAFGMLRALQNAGLAGKVKFVGFDSSAALIKGVRDGEVAALVVQDPERMGYLGVKTLVESIRGKSVEQRVDTGAVLIDGKNIDQPEIAKLIAPPKE